MIQVFSTPAQDQKMVQYAEKVSDSLGKGNNSYSACLNGLVLRSVETLG
jgi:hypothetical protein